MRWNAAEPWCREAIAAETIWADLVGASPRQPAPFFGALLAKQDGKLLAYYSALSALDIQHQRFFTRTASRTGKFYELFKDSPEIQRSKSRRIQPGSFVEFLSEVPLTVTAASIFRAARRCGWSPRANRIPPATSRR